MPTAEAAAPRQWLLPHERWLGRFAGRGANPLPGGKRWDFQQNYGPEGDVFLSAATADVIVALILGFTGWILLVVSGSRGSVTAAGYWLMGVGIFTALIGVVRAIQIGHAGRAFRAGRPFARATRRSFRG